MSPSSCPEVICFDNMTSFGTNLRQLVAGSLGNPGYETKGVLPRDEQIWTEYFQMALYDRNLIE